MQKFFDGKRIRDEIIEGLKNKVAKMDRKPGLAVFLIGNDVICERYVALKKRIAEKIGVFVRVYKFDENSEQQEIISKIKELNTDNTIDGIMIQIPIPKNFDKFEIINAISPEKDVDGLRFCGGFHSHFTPPVVLAILKAVELANKNIEDCEVLVIGRGFLVGWPVAQCMEEAVKGLIIADRNTKNLSSIAKTADVIISATGEASLVKPDMVKEGAVLIDAGTSEVGGELLGDIDTECYDKACYYTPVPGGIGPVTVAMLLKNLVEK